jgi:ribosomal protein S19E (S16A)
VQAPDRSSIDITAAIVRKVYLRQGTGVGALKKRFGGNYRCAACI